MQSRNNSQEEITYRDEWITIMARDKTLDYKIDAIVAFVDEMLLLHQYKVVDAICGYWDFSIGLELTITLLAVTLQAKDHLRVREVLLADAKKHFKDERDIWEGL
jgi:hypothetical protein